MKSSLFPPGLPKPLYLLVTPIEFVSNFLVRPFSLAIRLFANLMAGRSGIRRLTSEFAPRLASKIGGEVDFDPAAHFPKPKLALLDRFSQFALVAAREALGDARIDPADPRKARTGVYIGTSVGGTNTTEAAYADLFTGGKDRLPPYTVIRVMNNAAAAHISIDHALRGPSLTYSTACSSSGPT